MDQSLQEHKRLGTQYREALKAYDSAKPDSCFRSWTNGSRALIVRPRMRLTPPIQQVQQFETDTTRHRTIPAANRLHANAGVMRDAAGVAFALFFGWSLGPLATGQLAQLADNLGGNSREFTAAASQVSAASQSLAEGPANKPRRWRKRVLRWKKWPP